MQSEKHTCVICTCPAHEQTAWVLDRDRLVILCGGCAKDFAKWFKGRMAQMNRCVRGESMSFSEAAARSIIGDPPPNQFVKRILGLIKEKGSASISEILALGGSLSEQKQIYAIMKSVESTKGVNLCLSIVSDFIN
jgi:hypothetical protein